MKTVGNLFDDLGGSSAVAKGIGVGQSTASEMRRRNSIPVKHWPKLISFAASRGKTIDAAMLVTIHVGGEIAQTIV